MLTYNQRYRPRTTREYTKSDLTVYDSAGNTALNALTVYGKSEVVDGAIKSAGEGYAVVKLADLTWEYAEESSRMNPRFYSRDIILTTVTPDVSDNANILCTNYVTESDATVTYNKQLNKGIAIGGNKYIYIVDKQYTAVSDFVASLGDATLAYQLADPTQGNAIAVKTDNGSGVNGTMATFTTGTPLRGIPDTDVRDVMVWDGSAGEVTKVCNKVRLADLTWTAYNAIYYAPISDKINNQNNTGICSSYNIINSNPTSAGEAVALLTDNNSLALSKDTSTPYIYIRADNYSTVSDFVASLGNAELVYELATPTTEQLTSTENASIASLQTFDGTTHFTNNASTDMIINYTIKVPTIS